MYCMPLLERTGNRPVKSEKILPVFSTRVRKVSFVFVTDVGDLGCDFEVLFRFWSRCPMSVSGSSFMCLFTENVEMEGHVVKYPADIARSHVDLAGLKHAAWRNLMRSLWIS